LAERPGQLLADPGLSCYTRTRKIAYNVDTIVFGVHGEFEVQKLVDRLIPKQISWRRQSIESLLLLAVYGICMLLLPPGSKIRILIGDLAVLVPLVTAFVLTYVLLPMIQPQARSTWRFVGIAFLFWSLGNGIRTFDGLSGVSLPIFSLADICNFAAYPFFFYALVLYPFENRYAPSRFRFLLDATIITGVVATLGWLVLASPSAVSDPRMVVPLIYPIGDLILLMILFNILLANRIARRTTIILGVGILAFFFSDFVYATLAQVGSFQSGGPDSLGWVVGGLIFCLGSVIESNVFRDSGVSSRRGFDLGVRIQNVLPVTLVLVLFWFVIVDWQFAGVISVFGLLMSLILALILIVRMGIRAGESELYKYWQLFSGLAEPTFICDNRGKLILANPATLKLLDLTGEHQLAGVTLASIMNDQSIPDDLLDLATRQECTLEVSIRPDGAPYMLSLGPIFSEGRKVLIAGAAHDLREQKKQQEAVQKAYNELQTVYSQLEELNAQLEQKVEQRTSNLQQAYHQLEEQNTILKELDQLKSDFVSMVSHELRTPLTSINGGLELLLNRKGRPYTERQPLELMRHEVQRLTGFVENILNLSAMEAGRLVVHSVPVAISSVLEGVCQNCRALPGAERIKLSVPDDLPSVKADPVFLEGVLNHLIDNALKYAPDGMIMVDAFQKGTRLRVQVTDMGPGIPVEKRHLLFKRFQRLDASDSQSVYGYGLGLYLSQRMLRAMGSDLYFEAPASGGARFYLDLKVIR
jgi:signal transduction histidine kinase